jgi:hypothetical protein
VKSYPFAFFLLLLLISLSASGCAAARSTPTVSPASPPSLPATQPVAVPTQILPTALPATATELPPSATPTFTSISPTPAVSNPPASSQQGQANNPPTQGSAGGELSISPNQVVVQNGVSATLTSPQVSRSRILATICFNLPDTSDWSAYPRIEGQFFESLAGELVNYDASTMQSTYRCYLYKFYNSKGFNLSSGQELAIVIDALQTNPPEAITPEMVERANQRLAPQGVQFTIETQAHAMGFKILAKPENMSEETAYQLIQNALSESIPGPWRFSVMLP